MAKEYAKSFYKSKAWLSCREGFINSKHGLCERCKSKGKYVAGKIVHHKTYITPENINDPYITLSFENLELLCSSCHNKEHGESKEPLLREGLIFDENGQLVSHEG